MGRIDVRVMECKNLPNNELVGLPDVYVKIELEHQVFQTTVAHATLSPKYGEVFKFTVADPDSAQVIARVYSQHITGDSFVGMYAASVAGLTRGVVRDETFLLQQCKGCAELRLQMTALDFGADPAGVAVTGVIVGGTHSSWGTGGHGAAAAAAAVSAPAPPPPPPPAVFGQPQWHPEIRLVHGPSAVEQALTKATQSVTGLFSSLVDKVATVGGSSQDAK